MPLTSDQFVGALNTLLRQPSGSGAEQRRESRVSVSGVVLLTAEDSDEPPIHAHLKDLSRGGVGFTHHAGLSKGRRLRLHLPSAEGEPHTVRCEVRHCSLVRDGLYLIGVVFLDDDAGPTTA